MAKIGISKWIREKDIESTVNSTKEKVKSWKRLRIQNGFARKVVKLKWDRKKDSERYNLQFANSFRPQYFHADSIWIRYLLREFTSNSLFVSRIHFQFTNYLAMHYLFRKSLLIHYFFSRIYIEFTIYFAISLWVHYFFCESTLNSESALRIHYQFTFVFVNSFRTDYLCREFNSNSFFYANTLSSQFEFTIFFVNSLRIHYFSREFTLNSLSFSKIHFQCTIYFVNSLSPSL